MTLISSGFTGSKPQDTNAWPARLWFVIFGITLTAWAALYLFSHSYMGISGYELSRFSSADIRHINSLLINGNTGTPQISSYQQPAKQRINNTNDGFLDNEPPAVNPEKYAGEYPQANNITFLSEEEIKRRRTRVAMTYIISQYGHDISQAELVNIERYISTFSPKETGIFLADYRLRLSSYFWFSGVYVYAEVIFWVIFGVLCSLLFYTGSISATTYSSRDVLYQTARLLYMPLAAVLLVLAYTYLKGGSTLHTEISEGVLIFVFLLGLGSGLILDIMDRIKRAIPAAITTGNRTEITDKEAFEKLVKRAEHAGTPVPVFSEPTVAGSSDTDSMLAQSIFAKKPVINKPAKDDNDIAEVAIDLKLDFGGLFEEERQQLQKLGFSKAIVTLHNVNGKDIIPAHKQTNDKTVFIAADVKPGIYIARATLSLRLRDDQIVNLFGEKTAYITEDKPGLELFVKKYEAAG